MIGTAFWGTELRSYQQNRKEQKVGPILYLLPGTKEGKWVTSQRGILIWEQLQLVVVIKSGVRAAEIRIYGDSFEP